MRAHNFVDLTGLRFGNLTVICLAGTGRKTRWSCLCDCGAEKTVQSQHLKKGLVKSCGCLRRKVAAEALRQLATVHGLCIGGTPAWYSAWKGMMDRCYKPKTTRFERYGGRGIDVAPEWHDPNQFLADMGESPPGMTLERRDNDAGYSSQNCRWATRKEQNNNRSTTLKITFGGKTLSKAEWAREIGVSKAAMYERLRKWPLERALSERP